MVLKPSLSFIVVSIEYFAGFLDGEGQISLARIPRARSNEYCIRISVYNTDRRILEEIRQTFGGALCSTASRSRRWKPSHALIWTNAAGARLLSEVAPHLRVKSQQAGALKDFVEHMHKIRRRRDRLGRLLPLPIRERKIREAFYMRLKKLNKRGSTTLRRRRSFSHDREPRILSLEYLAGFIDAEGCLMISRWHNPRYRRPHYGPRMCIGNTNRAILEDVQAFYGGILTDQPAGKAGWKDAYQLVWTGGMIEGLLSSVAPYLHVKRRQARLVMRFIRHTKKTKQGRSGRFFAPHRDEVVLFREALYRRMKELNAKGPKVPSGASKRAPSPGYGNVESGRRQ